MGISIITSTSPEMIKYMLRELLNNKNTGYDLILADYYQNFYIKFISIFNAAFRIRYFTLYRQIIVISLNKVKHGMLRKSY